MPIGHSSSGIRRPRIEPSPSARPCPTHRDGSIRVRTVIEITKTTAAAAGQRVVSLMNLFDMLQYTRRQSGLISRRRSTTAAGHPL